MIIFAIPLRSKASTNDWEMIERQFNRTIQSIFNQKESTNFKCIVACNDIPKLFEDYDDRLEFIKLDMPVPKELIEMHRDKFWKLTTIAVRINAILEEQDNPENGIYVMPVDADDILNCQIAKWCDEHPDNWGAVSKDGYVWNNENKKYFLIYPEMHTFCGSCNIIKMFKEDLPNKLPADISLCHDKKMAGILNARYPIRFDHNTVVMRYKNAGKEFALLPFRSTVYVRGFGDSLSSINQKKDNSKSFRFHPVAFLRKLNPFQYKFISNKIRNEFGIEKK